ncbi:MAG: chromosome segregation protein SMC [Planctomycetota bacterium]
MRLAKVTLHGFKSFADSTDFAFDRPITGIVGPNGCGKSNVVDAIKWVLGERSAKSLRGKEMADVIFAGSAGRKPAGMAAVTLTFENPLVEASPSARTAAPDDLETLSATLDAPTNADAEAEEATADGASGEPANPPDDPTPARPSRALALDTDTVDIERRLYRDGVSQYLINGRKVRLRDIRELFMDTGVGAHAYSIIEQGKVDAMLLASPIERRIFFEEAAGVAKFKARRVEAQRRLERTEANLVRTREQLESTERRLRIVKGQAAKAERFRALDAELRALQACLLLDQHDELAHRLHGLTSQITELDETRKHLTEELARAESEKQAAELARSDLAAKRSRADRERTAAEHTGQQADQRRALTERALAEAEEQLAGERHQLDEMATRRDELAQRITETEQLVGEGRETALRAEADAESAASARAEQQTELAEARRALGEHRADAATAERDRSGVQARLDADRRRLDTVRAESARFDEKRRTLDAERDELRTTLREHTHQFEEQGGRARTLSDDIAERLTRAESLSVDQRRVTERLNEMEQRHARLDSRREAIVELLERREGLAESVRTLMEQRDHPDAPPALAPIVAPLGELVETDTEHAAAVEAALGHMLEAVVVRGGADEVSALASVHLPGRITVLPTAGLTSSGAAPHADADETALLAALWPRVQPARALVRAAPEIAHILDRLLARTLVVADLDAAMLLAAGPLGGPLARGCWRFVTTDGSVIEHDARVTTGTAATGEGGAGLLQRRTELASLGLELSSVERELATLRTARRSLDDRATTLNDELADLRHHLAEAERARTKAESARDRVLAAIDRIDREAAEAERAALEASERAKAIEAERTDLAGQLAALDRRVAEAAERVAEHESAVEHLQHAVERAGDHLGELRAEALRQSERLAGAEREHRRLLRERDEVESGRLRVAQQVEHREARIESHRAAIAEATAEAESAAVEAKRIAASLVELSDQLAEASQASETLGERVGALRDRTRIVERDWQSLEMSKRELEVRREHLEEKAITELELDLRAESCAWAAMMADGDVAPIDREADEKEATDLRKQIKALGNVNLDAIEEAEALVGRNEELIQQVADIDAARAQLEELIDRLATASRERFREAFVSIQTHFSGQDGMFRRLFGGGKAELRLLPVPVKDEDGNAIEGEIDWLESGIEVMAKPPGKEPRSISQLSGGEKTMTAVALLMSIFQSKPSPFCVLDEVDAALDDANVERFCRIVKQGLDDCHFIVITHNKKTMRMADALIGVTQQERGVSTQVAVKFDEVKANGEIEAKPIRSNQKGSRTPRVATPEVVGAA